MSRTIIDGATGAFCGYCNIRFEEPGRPEIGIELVESCRGRGLGPLAPRMLIREEEGKRGADWCRAVVVGNNGASVSMMCKLNAKPDGLRLAPWFDEEAAAMRARRYR